MTDPSIQPAPHSPKPTPTGNLASESAVMASFQGVLRFTLIFGIVHAMLWCACIGLLLLYVPPAEQRFREYNMVLPRVTKFIIALSHIANDYFQLLPFLLAFWLLFEVPLLGILRHQSRGRGWAWGILHTLLPLLFLALVVYAVKLPLRMVTEGLSR